MAFRIFAQSTFAARSPTADTTRFTSASADRCSISSSSPIAHVEITFHPYCSRLAFNDSTFSCGPKSSGVTPNRLTLRKEPSFLLSGTSTNRFAISPAQSPHHTHSHACHSSAQKIAGIPVSVSITFAIAGKSVPFINGIGEPASAMNLGCSSLTACSISSNRISGHFQGLHRSLSGLR